MSEKFIFLNNEILRKRVGLESIRCVMDNLRNVGCHEEFLAESRGLNAVRLAEMVTPHSSLGLSARFQVASHLNLTVSNKHTVADLCSSV